NTPPPPNSPPPNRSFPRSHASRAIVSRTSSAPVIPPQRFVLLFPTFVSPPKYRSPHRTTTYPPAANSKCHSERPAWGPGAFRRGQGPRNLLLPQRPTPAPTSLAEQKRAAPHL